MKKTVKALIPLLAVFLIFASVISVSASSQPAILPARSSSMNADCAYLRTPALSEQIPFAEYAALWGCGLGRSEIR